MVVPRSLRRVAETRMVGTVSPHGHRWGPCHNARGRLRSTRPGVLSVWLCVTRGDAALGHRGTDDGPICRD